MPIPSIPDLMPNVLGYAADCVSIPETTPNGQGVPSFRDIFPFITQVAPDAGGLMIERAWMNSLFNLLGQHAFFNQSGGVYPWVGNAVSNTGLDYVVGCHVLGSDNVEYAAVKASGPDVPDVGVKDPTDPANQYSVADNPDGYWWAARPEEIDIAIARKAGGLDPGQIGIAQPGNYLNITEAGILSVDATVAAAAAKIPVANANGKLSPDWLPAGNTGSAGAVKLNNTVTSTSTTEAATANAVKQAYDKAASMTVPLNNTVTSTSTTEAATANAVKTAYDRAARADSTASSAYSTANSAYSMAAAAAPKPTTASGVGCWRLSYGPSTAFPIPSGGTWTYFGVGGANQSYYGASGGIAPGGSVVSLGFAGTSYGFCWRIS